MKINKFLKFEMYKSKKGSVFFTLLFAVLLFGAIFIIYFNSKSAGDLLLNNKKIGQAQLELFNTYQKGEDLLLYLDESARLSIKNATDILASNGGFYVDENQYADNLIGTPLWYYNGEDLRPRDYVDNFNEIYSEELRSYTSNYYMLPAHFSIYTNKDNNPMIITGSSEYNIEFTLSSDFNYEQEVSTNRYDNRRDSSLLDYSRLRTKKISRIVLHHTGGGGTAQGVIDVLKSRHLSIHYIIEKDGNVVSALSENRVAWHAGCNKVEDKTCVDETVNSDSIGIEIIDTGNINDPFDNQYANLEKLLRDICKRYDIPYNNDHIIGHYQITGQKWDPAPHFDWSKIGLSGHVTMKDLNRPCLSQKDWGGVCWV